MDGKLESVEEGSSHFQADAMDTTSEAQREHVNEFDPDETREIPVTPELEEARQELESQIRRGQVAREAIHNEHYEGINQDYQPTLRDKTEDVLFQLRMIPVMIGQLGAFHPARINGNWKWVVEPWAQIEVDPYQPIQGDNIYLDTFKPLKNKGVKTLDERTLPNGELPRLRPVGIVGLQYLDHNRIMAAQALGMKIAVKPIRGVETLS